MDSDLKVTGGAAPPPDQWAIIPRLDWGCAICDAEDVPELLAVYEAENRRATSVCWSCLRDLINNALLVKTGSNGT